VEPGGEEEHENRGTANEVNTGKKGTFHSSTGRGGKNSAAETRRKRRTDVVMVLWGVWS